MNDAYGEELAILPYVKNEIVAIAPTIGERSNFKKIPTHTQDHGDA